MSTHWMCEESFVEQDQSVESSDDMYESKLLVHTPHALFVYTVLNQLPPPKKNLFEAYTNEETGDVIYGCEYSTFQKFGEDQVEFREVGTGPTKTKACQQAAKEILFSLYPWYTSLKQIMIFLNKKIHERNLKLKPLMLPGKASNYDFQKDSVVLLNEVCQQLNLPFPELLIERNDKDNTYTVRMQVHDSDTVHSASRVGNYIKPLRGEVAEALALKIMNEETPDAVMKQLRDLRMKKKENKRDLKKQQKVKLISGVDETQSESRVIDTKLKSDEPGLEESPPDQQDQYIPFSESDLLAHSFETQPESPAVEEKNSRDQASQVDFVDDIPPVVPVVYIDGPVDAIRVGVSKSGRYVLLLPPFYPLHQVDESTFACNGIYYTY